jgi:hypothetical protein
MGPQRSSGKLFAALVAAVVLASWPSAHNAEEERFDHPAAPAAADEHRDADRCGSLKAKNFNRLPGERCLVDERCPVDCSTRPPPAESPAAEKLRKRCTKWFQQVLVNGPAPGENNDRRPCQAWAQKDKESHPDEYQRLVATLEMLDRREQEANPCAYYTEDRTCVPRVRGAERALTGQPHLDDHCFGVLKYVATNGSQGVDELKKCAVWMKQYRAKYPAEAKDAVDELVRVEARYRAQRPAVDIDELTGR